MAAVGLVVVLVVEAEATEGIVPAADALHVELLLERGAPDGQGDEIVARARREVPRPAAGEGREVATATATLRRDLDADDVEDLLDRIGLGSAAATATGRRTACRI